VYARSKAIDDMKPREVPFDFETIFHLEYDRVARIIARVVGEPARAEELAVDVFWKLWRNPRAQGDQVGGWLYRTAVRTGLYELRRNRRRARFEPFLRFTREPLDPEQIRAAAEEQEHVRRVLARMSARQAELLLLRGNDLSYEELANALQLNPASIGTLISRAQGAFRKEYIKQYGRPRNER
jgi:RNA polymerase sigma-70 factor (ECF subfamily)